MNFKPSATSLDMDAKQLRSRSNLQHLEIHGIHKTNGSIMVVRVRGAGKFNITAGTCLIAHYAITVISLIHTEAVSTRISYKVRPL